MSDDDPERSARRPFEIWLFETLPFNLAVSVAAIFACLYGAFLLSALAAGSPPLLAPDSPYLISVQAWVALILSLIVTVALGTTYYTRRAPIEEGGALREALSGDARAIARIERTTIHASLAEAVSFWIGVVPGFLLAWEPFSGSQLALIELLAPSRLWFLIVMPVSIGLLARAIVNSVRSDRALAGAIRTAYEHDPLRPERGFVFGRMALRDALTWFLISAVIMLFFIRGAGGVGASITIAISILGALSSLVIPLAAVRTKIRQAKDGELTRLHGEMMQARDRALAGDAGEAARLGGLAGYEQSLKASPDWPLSAPVTTRFFLYILIPVVPWFGSALAERLVMDMAR